LMPLHDEPLEHAGQVILAGFPAGEPPPELHAALRARSLTGVILFKRNVTTPLALARWVRQLTGAAPDEPPLVAVDQEGGRVQRLGPPVLQLPPMRRLGELDDPDLTRRVARALG